jgi:hypothetical protein
MSDLDLRLVLPHVEMILFLLLLVLPSPDPAFRLYATCSRLPIPKAGICQNSHVELPPTLPRSSEEAELVRLFAIMQSLGCFQCSVPLVTKIGVETGDINNEDQRKNEPHIKSPDSTRRFTPLAWLE